MANQFGFDRVQENIKAMKDDLPKVLANQAQSFFVKSWANQAWEGQQWKEVKRRIVGTPEYKYPKNKGLGRRTKAILVGTGRLRRAVATSIRSQQFNNIRLVVDLPYAEVINEGGAHMPKRTFMKDNPTLRGMQGDKIKEFTDKIWK